MNNILLEYFSGKNPKLLELEKAMNDLVRLINSNYKDHAEINVLRKRNLITLSPENKKVEKILSSIFNGAKFDIMWNTGTLNVYTFLPMVWHTLNLRDAVDKNKKVTSNFLTTNTIVLYEDLVFKADLNNRELIAVILHEIGHTYSILPISMFITCIYSIIGLPANLLIRFATASVTKLGDVLRVQCPIFFNIIEMFKVIRNEIYGNLLVKISNIPAILSLTLSRLISNLSLLPYRIEGYGAEENADSFASAYGYGAELITALEKLRLAKKTFTNEIINSDAIPEEIAYVYRYFEDLYSIFIILISILTLDPHPNTNQRYQTQLRRLKEDLEKGKFEKEKKKELEEQIHQLESIYKTLNSYPEQEGVNLKKNLFITIDKATKGNSDFREIFSVYFDACNNIKLK